MKFLITGGAGFVGGNLAMKLAENGHEVFCIDNMSRRGSENNLKRFSKSKNIKFLHCDIRNKEDLDRIICAEIPDKTKNKRLYEIITKHNIHGP